MEVACFLIGTCLSGAKPLCWCDSHLFQASLVKELDHLQGHVTNLAYLYDNWEPHFLWLNSIQH
jgi:hypothetical protein